MYALAGESLLIDAVMLANVDVHTRAHVHVGCVRVCGCVCVCAGVRRMCVVCACVRVYVCAQMCISIV